MKSRANMTVHEQRINALTNFTNGTSQIHSNDTIRPQRSPRIKLFPLYVFSRLSNVSISTLFSYSTGQYFTRLSLQSSKLLVIVVVQNTFYLATAGLVLAVGMQVFSG